MSQKAADKKVEEPKEITTDVVKGSDVEKMVRYSIAHYTSISNFIRLAEYLRTQQEYGCVLLVCKEAQERLRQIESDRVARELRLLKIGKVEAKLKEKIEKEKLKGDLGDKLTDNESTLLKWIQMEKTGITYLPAEITLSQNANFDYQVQIAEIMIGSVLESCALREARMVENKVEIDDITLDEVLQNTIETCTEQVINPSHLMRIATTLSKKGKYDLALNVCKKAQKRIHDMRHRLQQRIKLEGQRVLLEKEELRLKDIKKGLSEPQKKLLDTHKSLKQLPRVYQFDPENNNAYDNLALEVTQQMLKTAMDYKHAIKHKKELVKKNLGVYTKKEKKAVDENTSEKLIKDVLLECMKPGNVEDPFHLTKIAEQLFTGDEWDLVYPVIEQARKNILELIDNYKQLQLQKKRTAELVKERTEAYKEWKPELFKNVTELERLEFDNYVYENWTSTYKKNSPEKLDDLHLKLMKLLIDNMMTHFVEGKVEYDAKSQALLESIEKPVFLYNLAKHMEGKWKVANDVVVEFGKKCQNITRKVEEMRQRRAPITKERDELKNKIEDLEKRNREPPKEDKERLATLEKQLSALPPWPEYAKLDDPYQYDELNLDVVRVMISAILNNKVAYEEGIVKYRAENPPSKVDNKQIEIKRAAIQKDIQNLVQSTLERFLNPADLLKVARDMKARQEVDIVLQISVKSLARILDIEVQRRTRNQVLEVLEAAKKAKDKNKVAEQEKKLAALPVWPHYAILADPTQYNNTKYEIVKVGLDAVLEHQTKVEANITQQYYNNKKGVSESSIKEQRDVMENNIDQVVKLINANIKDANRLNDIAKDLSHKKQASILLKIAPAFYDHIRSLEKIRITKDKRDCWVSVLQAEKSELQRIKRDLSDELTSNLTSLEQEVKEEKEGKKPYKYPSDLKDSNGHNDIIQEFTILLVRTVFATNQQIEQVIADDKDKDTLTESRVNYLLAKVAENIKAVVDMITKNVESPLIINQIVRQFNEKLLYKEGIKFGLDAVTKKDKVADLQERNQALKDRKDKLVLEKEDLDKRRKKLTKEQTDELRNLNLELSLFNKNPTFIQTIQPQQLGVDISKDLITTMAKAKTPQKEADSVVDLCLRSMTDVPILIQFSKWLLSQTEYRYTIKSGKKTEELINEFYLDLEKREGLKKKVSDLEEQRLKALATAGTSGEPQLDPKLKDELENAKKELEVLPEIDYDKAKLDSWMLEISEVVINAAKVEDDDETLREQTVMAFKIDTSIQRWDQVRNMVSDETWEKIKKELVVFVLQRDDNPVDKIELLMKDGLFEYCVKLFPAATGQGKELDLLLRLWTSVEENEPKLLEKFIPIVGRYVKRYYQEHKYSMVDPLLDKVAHWFPSTVVHLYKQATDMVLLWILPSQYTSFCDAMKACKKRLVEDLLRPQDWDDLVRDFKRQHYGKRKLLQMLLAVVDDPDWTIETVNEGKKS